MITKEQATSIIDGYKNKMPVPIISIAKKLKIAVFSDKDMPDKRSGKIERTTDGKYEITINANHSPQRIRFTIAHEIAHFEKHRDDLDEQGSFIDATLQPTWALNRDNSMNHCSKETKMKEKEANARAAEILMPENEFKAVFNSSNSIYDVAKKFDVSIEAATIRATNVCGQYMM